VDSPWERLQWTVPSACLLLLLSMTVFLRLLAFSPPLPAPPLDARIVELGMPAGGSRGGGAKTAPPPSPVHEPAHEKALQTPKKSPSRPRVHPARPPASGRNAERRPLPSDDTKGAAKAGGGSGREGSAGAGSHLGGGKIAARAIYKPIPVIPEELRRRPIETVAVARFEIAPDGTAGVKLVRPTSEPALNRILLETLGTWRFFPALARGKPIASSLDIRIPISVR
jgi:protein TonB